MIRNKLKAKNAKIRQQKRQIRLITKFKQIIEDHPEPTLDLASGKSLEMLVDYYNLDFVCRILTGFEMKNWIDFAYNDLPPRIWPNNWYAKQAGKRVIWASLLAPYCIICNDPMSKRLDQVLSRSQLIRQLDHRIYVIRNNVPDGFAFRY